MSDCIYTGISEQACRQPKFDFNEWMGRYKKRLSKEQIDILKPLSKIYGFDLISHEICSGRRTNETIEQIFVFGFNRGEQLNAEITIRI